SEGARRPRDLTELRGVREDRPRAEGAYAVHRTTADPLRRPLLPDREPLPVQREVLPALGAALLHVRRLPQPSARGPRCQPGRRPFADAGALTAACTPHYADHAGGGLSGEQGQVGLALAA